MNRRRHQRVGTLDDHLAGHRLATERMREEAADSREFGDLLRSTSSRCCRVLAQQEVSCGADCPVLTWSSLPCYRCVDTDDPGGPDLCLERHRAPVPPALTKPWTPLGYHGMEYAARRCSPSAAP